MKKKCLHQFHSLDQNYKKSQNTNNEDLIIFEIKSKKKLEVYPLKMKKSFSNLSRRNDLFYGRK